MTHFAYQLPTLSIATAAQAVAQQFSLAIYVREGSLPLRSDPMPAFLVRLTKNRDIVGFFSADDLEELAEAVDECTDPPYCEYLELPSGGIMWTSPATGLPLRRGNEDEGREAERLPWASAELSETWWDGIYGYREQDWKPFDPDFTVEPDPPLVDRQMGPGQVIPLKGRKRG